MFTGIIEELGQVIDIVQDRENIHLHIQSTISTELKVDQSLSHNGICLTVTKLSEQGHWVTAVKETIQKTTCGSWKLGDQINLERAMLVGGRLDGHFVQGHVDAVATCSQSQNQDGSWLFSFQFPEAFRNLVIEKGSVCINGVSLTCFNVSENSFDVAIIPYTYEHTNFQSLKAQDAVNIEFDVLGKYILRAQEGK